MIRIPPNTAAHVRRGTGKWLPYRTTKPLAFESGRPHGTDHVVFGRDGWELMVHRTAAYDSRAEERSLGRWNKCILGRSGKGASRRRARGGRRR